MSEQKPAPVQAATPSPVEEKPAPARPAKAAKPAHGKGKTDTFAEPRQRAEGKSDDPFLSFIFGEAPKYARLCVVLPNGFIQGIDDPNQISRVGGQIILTTSKGIYTVRDLFLQQPVATPIQSQVEKLSVKNAELEQKAIAEAQAKKRLADQLAAKQEELAALQRKLQEASEPAKRR